MVKESRDADEQSVDIRRSPNLTFEENQLPEELIPGGLTSVRRKYLYTTVRQFVRPAYKDVTCPPYRLDDQ